MTPNGAVAFAVLVIVAAALSHEAGLVILFALAGAFAALEVGAQVAGALRRAALIMAPLAAFMLLVWVGIVGRTPDEITAGVPGSRAAAALYVAIVCARLFLIVFTVQAVIMRSEGQSPHQFIRALYAPLAAKRMFALTLSLVDTLRSAIDRTHTALVAAGIITPGLSLRNARNGWVLVQTVWLTAVTSVTGRMRDKWPVEGTLALLDPLLEGKADPLSRADAIWMALAAAAMAVTLGLHLA